MLFNYYPNTRFLDCVFHLCVVRFEKVVPLNSAKISLSHKLDWRNLGENCFWKCGVMYIWLHIYSLHVDGCLLLPASRARIWCLRLKFRHSSCLFQLLQSVFPNVNGCAPPTVKFSYVLMCHVQVPNITPVHWGVQSHSAHILGAAWPCHAWWHWIFTATCKYCL